MVKSDPTTPANWAIKIDTIHIPNIILPQTLSGLNLIYLKLHPEATGKLSTVLVDLSRIAKTVSFVQFKTILKNNPNVAGFASEEEAFVAFPHNNGAAKYVVWTDPLDGSSNFETCVSIGSIFAIYERATELDQSVTDISINRAFFRKIINSPLISRRITH